MPRFYFHVSDGTEFIEDQEGHALSDEKEARRIAIKGAREIMADELRGGDLNLKSFIEVEDDKGVLLFTLTFADAINIAR